MRNGDSNNIYVDVAEVSQGDVVVPITSREMPSGDKLFSCMFARKHKHGEGLTPWLRRRDLKVLRDLLEKVERRMLEVEAEAASAAAAR